MQRQHGPDFPEEKKVPFRFTPSGALMSTPLVRVSAEARVAAGSIAAVLKAIDLMSPPCTAQTGEM
jgi:hypothetical protein